MGYRGFSRFLTLSLRRCRSFCVETHFTDEQVLSNEFLQTVKNAMEVAVPFVHQINEASFVSLTCAYFAELVPLARRGFHVARPFPAGVGNPFQLPAQSQRLTSSWPHR